MKKYVVFIISFALLYTVLQILSGMFLTAVYTPQFSSMASNEEVHFGRSIGLPFELMIFLTASLAYFVSQKFVKTK